MVITKRDNRIMNTCQEQWFMTLVQIAMMFFKKSQNIQQRPVKRVRDLVNEGYLRSMQLRIGEKRLYVVTQKGLQQLRKKKLPGGSMRVVKRINDKTWEHDEAVTNVRIVFQTLLGFTEWMPERLLKKKSRQGKVPDGIASDEERRFVIEVETSLKNKAYYRRVLPQFEAQYHDDMGGILYVVKDATDMKWLMEQAKMWKSIHFALLEDVMTMRDGVTFRNADDQSLYLERFYRGSVLLPGFKWEGMDLRDIPEEELDEFQRGQLECEQFARAAAEERAKRIREQGDSKNAA